MVVARPEADLSFMDSDTPEDFHDLNTGVKFTNTKTYTHSVGLSCCFRQHGAESHCRFLHGYALSVAVTFSGPLNSLNWVRDFGKNKTIKKFLENTFDHKTLVAIDDPQHSLFLELHQAGLIDMVTLPAISIERFAEHILLWIEAHLMQYREQETVVSVRVREHEGNEAMAHRE